MTQTQELSLILFAILQFACVRLCVRLRVCMCVCVRVWAWRASRGEEEVGFGISERQDDERRALPVEAGFTGVLTASLNSRPPSGANGFY